MFSLLGPYEIEGNCQILPHGDEMPCNQRGYRGRDGDLPQLCWKHREEYGRRTAEYKETSAEAKHLHAQLCLNVEALRELADAEQAVEAASRCIDALYAEIRQREAHHQRFFRETDKGHRMFIKQLRAKMCDVEDAATRIRQKKTDLVDEQKRRVEEMALGEKSQLTENGLVEGEHPSEPESLCQVMLPEGEPSCLQRGSRGPDGGPFRLCAVHHEEYGRLLAEYMATSEKATRLYALVRLDRYDLRDLSDVEKAMETAGRCIDTLQAEISQREEHHRRFFVELDESHQTCIQGLYGKLHRAKDVARELFQKKTALLDEWKLRVEEKERLEAIRLAAARLAEHNRVEETQKQLAEQRRFAEEKALAEESHLAAEGLAEKSGLAEEIHTTGRQEDLCQIVPHEDEPPCSERGHRGPDGRLPHLCSAHREEYVRRTTEYEATFEEATRLYALVPYSDAIVCGLADLDKAMETARRCIGTLQMEMHQREDYLRRFFLEPDEGHEIRLQHLRNLINCTEKVAKQLSQQKTALADAQRRPDKHQHTEQTRIAEQRRVEADERRLAEERQRATEHLSEQRLVAECLSQQGRTAEAYVGPAPEQRLDSVERPIANGSWVAEEKHITGEGSRAAEERQLTAERFAEKKRIAEERRLAQVKRRTEGSRTGERLVQATHFMAECRERETASSSQLGRALSTNLRSHSLPTGRYYHSNLYTSSTTTRTRSLPAHRTCVAYHTHPSKYGRIRCSTEALHGVRSRCQPHQNEYDQAISELRAVQVQHRNADVTVRDIQSRWRKLRRKRAYTIPQLAQDSLEVTRFLQLGGDIKGLATTVRRLEGYPQTKKPDEAVGIRDNYDPLDPRTAEDLLAELEDTRLKLLRRKPGDAANNASAPAQNGQAGEDRGVTATQSTAPPVPSKDTSGHPVGAASATTLRHRVAASVRRAWRRFRTRT